MKTLSINVLVLGLAGLVMFGCSNQELESRIAKLEGKVAELEGSGTASPTIQPTTAAAAAQPEVKPEGPVPEINFDENLFDFGDINEGDIVDHTFAFTNVGQAPLIISSASASCGCTVPKWPKEPIPVGGSGEIKVQFNSKNKPGVQNKTVTITANTYPKLTKINIKAVVSPQKKDNPS